MPRAGLSPGTVTLIAAEVADAQGLDRVTPSTVAAAAGVRTPSLYVHVGGAVDLRKRLTMLALAELAERGRDAVGGSVGRSGLQAYGDALRTYARNHPGRYAAAQAPLDPAEAAVSAGPDHAELLRGVLTAYGLSPAMTTHAVRIVGSALHGFIALEGSGGFDHSDPSSDATWGRLLAALDAMLLTFDEGEESAGQGQ